MEAMTRATAAARMIAEILYVITPNLERFNIRDVVAYGRPYPAEMLPQGMIYAAAYVVICLTMACLLLSRRDLP